ncbi:hypothetical protein K2X33_13870 [bacterium]|nr:hypothetical protein [bacterium]
MTKNLLLTVILFSLSNVAFATKDCSSCNTNKTEDICKKTQCSEKGTAAKHHCAWENDQCVNPGGNAGTGSKAGNADSKAKVGGGAQYQNGPSLSGTRLAR